MLKIGHCQEGTSDKVYVVRVLPSLNGTMFGVRALAGRRNGTLRQYYKGSFPNERAAQLYAAKVFAEKTQKSKKPYVDIADPNYEGPLTLTDSWLSAATGCDWMEYPASSSDNEAPTEDIQPSDDANTAQDWEVICMNASGMEDSFEEGVVYLAEAHPGEGFLYVWDDLGNKRECLEERFVRAEMEGS